MWQAIFPNDPFTSSFHEVYRAWYRLEPRSRSNEFEAGLAAKIADPLWMLTRQWQMGEFRAEDAGHPVDLEVVYSTHPSTTLITGEDDHSQYLGNRPLESLVEYECEPMNYRLRVQIGQQFERLLRSYISNYNADHEPIAESKLVAAYRDAIGFELPADEELVELDERTKRFIQFMAGRVVDGQELLASDARNTILDVLAGLEETSAELEEIVIEAFEALLKWRSQLLMEPSDDIPSSWVNSKLHYNFKVGENNLADPDVSVNLVASDYRNGELDWYMFAFTGSIPPVRMKRANLLPTRLDVAGQSPRWWTFADKQFNLSQLDPQVTDLGKLLFTRFITYYSDDWSQAPLTVDIGSLIHLHSIRVTDVFGKTMDLQPARAEGTSPLNRWEMFTLSQDGASDAPGVANMLFVPPMAGYRAESEPLEEIRFLRDEDANMVWAVESIVRNGLGEPAQGFEAQRSRWVGRIKQELKQLRAAYKNALADSRNPELGDREQRRRAESAAELEQEIVVLEALLSPQPRADAIPRYLLSTTVPENWIPFLPYNIGDFFDRQRGSITLLRAKLWRETDEDQESILATNNGESTEISDQLNELITTAKYHPKDLDAMTSLLQVTGKDSLLFLEEETVPRAGVRVLLTKQRVRWTDGNTYVWLGRKVLTGRGEGSSGLKFDVIQESP